MRTRTCVLMIAPTLLAASAAFAEMDTGTATPEQALSSEAPGADARERGLAALEVGDYLTAAAAFREAADHGDAAALRHLGDLSFSGQGVAQRWLKIAASVWACAVSISSARERSPNWTAFAYRVNSVESAVRSVPSVCT